MGVRRRAAALAVTAVLAGCAQRAEPTSLPDAPRPVTGIAGTPQVAWTWSHRSTFNDFDSLVPLDGGVLAGVGTTLARLDATGQPQWVRRLDEAAEWRFVTTDGSLALGVALDDSSRHGTTAVAMADGHVAWHRHDTAIAPLGDGVLSSDGADVVAVDRSGHTRWRRDVQTYAVGGDGVVVGTRGRVADLDEAGHAVWSSTVPGGDVESLSVGPRMVVVATQHDVVALDARDGHRRWTRRTSLGALAGLLTPTTAWVLATHANDEDSPKRTVVLLDVAGRERGRIRVPSPAFSGSAFRVGGTSYVLDGGRLLTATGRRLTTLHSDVQIPSTTGVYAVTDRSLTLHPFGPGKDRWTVAFPDGGGLSATPANGAVYVVLPTGVVKYAG